MEIERQPFNRRHAQKTFDAMKAEHLRYIPAYRDLSTFVNQKRGIYENDRTLIGEMIDHKRLLSGYATYTNRIFASGLSYGMTNKASQWFKLSLSSEEAMDQPGVRNWLDQVEKKMYAILNQSNLYDAFYSVYEELGQFGTGCFVVLEDFEDVVRSKIMTAGEYFLKTNNKGKVDGFAREFEMTVGQNVTGVQTCALPISCQ